MKKRKLIIFGSIFFIILLIALLPTLLSTQAGKNSAIRLFSKDLTIDTLKLRWLGPQEIKGISYPGFTCEEVTIQSSLWSLMLRKDIGLTHVIKPQMTITPQPHSQKTAAAAKEKSNDKNNGLPFTGHLILDAGDLKVDNVHFEKIHVDLNLLSPIVFQASGETTQDKVSGQFNLEGYLQPAEEELVIEGNLIHFPIKGIDQIVTLFYPNMEGVLTDTVGPSFDAKIKARMTKEAPEFTLTASSSHLKASVETTTNNGKLSLKTPATLSLTLIPSLVEKLCGCKPTSTAQLQLKLEDLQVPLNNPKQMSLRGFLTLSETRLSPTLTLTQLRSDFSTKNAVDGIDITQSSSFQFKGPLVNTLGKSATLSSQGKLFLEPLQGEFILSLLSERLQAEKISLAITPNKQLELVSPTTLCYFPQNGTPVEAILEQISIPLSTPEQMVVKLNAKAERYESLRDIQLGLKVNGLQNIALGIKEKHFETDLLASYTHSRFALVKPLTLRGIFSNDLLPKSIAIPFSIKPSPFQLTLRPFSIDLNQDLLPQLKLNAEGSIERLSISPKNETNEINFDRLQVKMQLDAQKQMALCELSSKGIDLHLSLDHLIFKECLDTSQATLGLNLDLNHFPMDLLETWFDCSLKEALGPYFDLRVKALSSPQSQTLSIVTKSQFLNGQIALAVKDGMLALQNSGQPGKIDITLTKEGFAFFNHLFNQKMNLQLAQESSLSALLTQFKWPVTIQANPTSLSERIPSLHGNFAEIRLQGNAAIDSLSLIEKKTGKTANLKYLKFSFDKAGVQEPIRLHLDGLVSSKSSKEGKITLDSTLDHLFTPTGELDRNSMVADIQGSLENFPTLLLDLFNKEAKLSQLFGSTLFVTLKAHIQKLTGPVHLTVQAPTTRASLNGQLKNGVLYLSEPIYTQIQLTPDVSKFILGSANPLSITQITSENPLTLQIDPQNFAIPLFPFNLSQMRIGNARIELGKIRCKNEGTLNFTLGLLKSNQFSTANELLLWFAPMDLQLQNGLLNIERTEILIGETFDVALWGTIDLIKNDVEMVLGLTADSLQMAFAIRNLPPDYVLQIPLVGKLDNIEINKTAATAKITTLLIWQNKAVTGALRGSGVGALFGELINRFGPLPDFDKKAPPAKRPFPWETYEPAKKKTSQKIDFNDKPLKQLYKVMRG